MPSEGDQAWRLEQIWSPVSRGEELQFREEVPYLTQVIDGRAVILDYAISNDDGSWSLASNPEVSYASTDEIFAIEHPLGQEWRLEEIGFNPYANIEVEEIGVRFTDGVAIDYTVEVTDRDGTFHVWARNLDRALELQFLSLIHI